jgi:tetratricopeptide (TPR) repeat protein
LARNCLQSSWYVLFFYLSSEIFDKKKFSTDVHRKKGDYKESHELYLQALKQMESLYGQDHPFIADIMNNLGMLLKKEGKYNEALDYYKQAFKICKHYHGEQHPSIGIYLTNMGDIYRKVNQNKNFYFKINSNKRKLFSKVILEWLKIIIREH